MWSRYGASRQERSGNRSTTRWCSRFTSMVPYDRLGGYRPGEVVRELQRYSQEAALVAPHPCSGKLERRYLDLIAVGIEEVER